MKENIAIKVSHVNKSFKVPHEKHSSLKAAAVNIFSTKKYTKFKALEDIDFEIKKGEFFGIVGKNGSGKSTLLKILANIYQPNGGKVEINGTLAPFIELGVGFNAELTGRENVFLSGTILGMKKKKIEQIYDEIVAFAEIEEFMDQKLKNYSSGMQVRLAFSIAVRAESDILLIDEVLAVGDSAFQAKCFDYFYKLKESNKTIVFVSHDMESMKRFCDRAAYIDDSRVVAVANPSEVASLYFRNNFVDLKSDKPNTANPNKNIFIKKIVLLSKNKNTFEYGDKIEVRYEIFSDTEREVIIGGSILGEGDHYVAGYNSSKDLGVTKIKKGKTSFQLSFEADQLTKGTYHLCGALMTPRDKQIINDKLDGPFFQITNDLEYTDGNFNVQAKWSKL